MNSMLKNLKPKAKSVHDKIEDIANTAFRTFDNVMEKVGIGGVKAHYDDVNYHFVGGEKEELRKKHYDKSLRLLWKAYEHAPWSTFDDCTKAEKELLKMAKDNMSDEEKTEYSRISGQEYKDFLKKTYSRRERQALVNVISAIGHGEAYAWMVSAELLGEVKSTGGKAALTAQVLEEAKHFVVLRELVRAFDVPVPRMSAWEYHLMERSLKSKGLEKFFAMNVLIEGFALSIFGMFSTLPGLEIMRLFHLDESRHTALPFSYFKEFPMSDKEMDNIFRRTKRLSLVLPAIPVLIQFEEDLAVLGIDSFDLGGSMARKILKLSDRVGFKLPITNEQFSTTLNFIFNNYCKLSRKEHTTKDYLSKETTRGKLERAVEREIFEQQLA